MQIVCPNCTTSYQIADVAIGASGRSVRCVRCQTMWHRDAAGRAGDTTNRGDASRRRRKPSPHSAPRWSRNDRLSGPAPAPAGRRSADDLACAHAPNRRRRRRPCARRSARVRAGRHPYSGRGRAAARAGRRWRRRQPPIRAEIDNGPPDIESVAARRARAHGPPASQPRSGSDCRWRSLPWCSLRRRCSAGARTSCRHAPQLASFYSAIGLPVNLRGLAFTDLKIGNEIHDGVPVLVVEGMIVSTVSKPVDVPRLRFALRNATGAEVYSWTAPPPQPVLGAVRNAAVPHPARLAARGGPRYPGAVLHPPRRGRRPPLRQPWRAS